MILSKDVDFSVADDIPSETEDDISISMSLNVDLGKIPLTLLFFIAQSQGIVIPIHPPCTPSFLVSAYDCYRFMACEFGLSGKFKSVNLN